MRKLDIINAVCHAQVPPADRRQILLDFDEQDIRPPISLQQCVREKFEMLLAAVDAQDDVPVSLVPAMRDVIDQAFSCLYGSDVPFPFMRLRFAMRDELYHCFAGPVILPFRP